MTGAVRNSWQHLPEKKICIRNEVTFQSFKCQQNLFKQFFLNICNNFFLNICNKYIFINMNKNNTFIMQLIK